MAGSFFDNVRARKAGWRLLTIVLLLVLGGSAKDFLFMPGKAGNPGFVDFVEYLVNLGL